MTIKKIDIFQLEIPLLSPFETSFGRIEKRPAIIIKMTANGGSVGYGEASPLFLPISESETVESGMDFLKNHAPRLLGIPIRRENDITLKYPDDTHPVTRIGLESAYIDLFTRSEGVSVVEYFAEGETPSSEVQIGESVGLKDSASEVIEEIKNHLEKGVGRIKIKIAPGKDFSVIEKIHNSFPGLNVGVDANAAYDRSDLDQLSKLTRFNISFIEQPFRADDYESHSLLKKKGLVVCLDETVRDLETCRKAIKAGACDMVNIKPARIGSFKETKLVYEECVSSGIRLFGGGRLETGLGKTMNAAFYALPGFSDPSDITPPQEYLAEDIIDPPFSVSGGSYKVPKGSPGTGISVNEETLKRFSKKNICFEI